MINTSNFDKYTAVFYKKNKLSSTFYGNNLEHMKKAIINIIDKEKIPLQAKMIDNDTKAIIFYCSTEKAYAFC